MDRIYARAYNHVQSERIVSIPDALHVVKLDNPAAFDAALDVFFAPEHGQRKRWLVVIYFNTPPLLLCSQASGPRLPS